MGSCRWRGVQNGVGEKESERFVEVRDRIRRKVRELEREKEGERGRQTDEETYLKSCQFASGGGGGVKVKERMTTKVSDQKEER